jgi:hypothetical protein
MLSRMSAVPAARSSVVARALPTRLVLGGIVASATVLHALLARLIVAPSVFPDGYLYSQLARSLATTGRLEVRGVPAHFPALLEPLLTAPLWLVHDVGTAYRLVQLENAFVMSLAAVPAYLIARRLRLSAPLSLALAALAVAGPQMTFAGLILSEPFAYPLSLAVVAAALRAYERPSPRAQVLLLALCGLAVLARVQLASLPLCVVAAFLAGGVRDGRLRATVREQRLFLAAVAVGLAGGIAFAALRGFGYYRLVGNYAAPGGAMRLGGVDVYVVLLAAGAALAPSAIVGLALALVRPRSRAEFLFGALTVVTTAAILVESVLWEHLGRTQERYLSYLLPLLLLSFGLRVSRPVRRPGAEVAVAAALAAIAALVPLNGAADASAHGVAPFFYAFNRLQLATHSNAETAAVFALAATALAAAGALAVALRRGHVLVLVLSFVTSLALLGGAVSWSSLLAQDGRNRALPANMSWVDAAARGPSTMLVLGDAETGPALSTLFWNPSVSHVVRLPGAAKIDLLDDPQATLDRDGTVRVAGAPLRGRILLFSGASSSATLAGARSVASFGAGTLWRPRSAARLDVVMNGRIPDGHVLRAGGIVAWGAGGRLAGWLEARVSNPAGRPQATVRLGRTTVSLPAGTSREVRFLACGAAPWTSTFAAAPAGPTPSGWRSPLVSMPRYVPDPGACR